MKLIILTLSLIFSLRLYALTEAIVKAPRAIVYSDVEMTSPIGYISNGKVIKVANKPRKNGTLYPLMVAGRLCFIEAENITFKVDEIQQFEELKALEHDFSINHISDKDKLNKNIFIRLKVGEYNSGSDWEQIASGQLSDTAKSANSIELGVGHRDYSKRVSFDFGIMYSFINQQATSFKSLSLEGRVYWSPMNFSLVSINIFGGLFVAGDVRFEVPSHFIREKGAGYGYTFGGEFRLFPFSKVGFDASVGIRQMATPAFDAIRSQLDNKIFRLEGMGGIFISGGLSVRI